MRGTAYTTATWLALRSTAVLDWRSPSRSGPTRLLPGVLDSIPRDTDGRRRIRSEHLERSPQTAATEIVVDVLGETRQRFLPRSLVPRHDHGQVRTTHTPFTRRLSASSIKSRAIQSRFVSKSQQTAGNSPSTPSASNVSATKAARSAGAHMFSNTARHTVHVSRWCHGGATV